MDGLTLRPWRTGDEAALVRHGDNRRIWRNLTNQFPSPYTREDAVAWIHHANALPDDAIHHAIEVDGEPVGGVGFARLADLQSRTAEIGYWVGEAHWGRGVATEALRRHTALAFAEMDFVRLQAGVLAWNPASCRVLEKAVGLLLLAIALGFARRLLYHGSRAAPLLFAVAGLLVLYTMLRP